MTPPMILCPAFNIFLAIAYSGTELAGIFYFFAAVPIIFIAYCLIKEYL